MQLPSQLLLKIGKEKVKNEKEEFDDKNDDVNEEVEEETCDNDDHKNGEKQNNKK